MTELNQILEQRLDFQLPYTNSEICYDALARFPSLGLAFDRVLIPAARRAGPLLPRLAEIEVQRQRAYSELLAERGTLREAEWPFDCCIADLYFALFDSLTRAVNASDLPYDDKLAALSNLEEALSNILDWNPTKRMELSFLLALEDFDEEE